MHPCYIVLIFVTVICCSFTSGMWYVPWVLGDEYIWLTIPSILLDVVGGIVLYVSTISFDPRFNNTRLENTRRMFLAYCICFYFYEIHKTGIILLGEYIWPLKDAWGLVMTTYFACNIYITQAWCMWAELLTSKECTIKNVKDAIGFLVGIFFISGIYLGVNVLWGDTLDDAYRFYTSGYAILFGTVLSCFCIAIVMWCFYQCFVGCCGSCCKGQHISGIVNCGCFRFLRGGVIIPDDESVAFGGVSEEGGEGRRLEA